MSAVEKLAISFSFSVLHRPSILLEPTVASGQLYHEQQEVQVASLERTRSLIRLRLFSLQRVSKPNGLSDSFLPSVLHYGTPRPECYFRAQSRCFFQESRQKGECYQSKGFGRAAGVYITSCRIWS